MNKMPDDMMYGPYGDYWLALANNYEAKMGKQIDWTDRGPMLGSLNLSYMFMYPPIINVQKFTDELNAETAKLPEVVDYPSLFNEFKSKHKHDYNLGEIAEMAKTHDIKIVCAESPIKRRV